MADEGAQAGAEASAAGASSSADATNAGAQGGQQQPAGTPAGQQGGNGGQQGSASPAGQQGSQQPDDARYRGLTTDLQRERRTRQQYERELAAAKAEAQQYQRQVAALAGVRQPAEGEQETREIQERFLKVFPQFRALVNLSPEQLQEVLTGGPAARYAAQAEAREWVNRGRGYLSVAGEQVAQALGVDKLSEHQSNIVRDNFAGWFKSVVEAELAASGGEHSATLQRYEQEDETLVSDFVTFFTNELIAPARRQSVAANVNRASQRVPNSAGRAPVTTSVARPTAFKNDDERLDYMAKIAREQGSFRS